MGVTVCSINCNQRLEKRRVLHAPPRSTIGASGGGSVRPEPSAGTQNREDGPSSLGPVAPKLEKKQSSPPGAAAYLLPGARPRGAIPTRASDPALAALLAQSQRRLLDGCGRAGGASGARAGKPDVPSEEGAGPGAGKARWPGWG